MMKSPRRCLEDILFKGKSDYPPFIIWDNKLPQGAMRDELLALNPCVIVKSAVYSTQLNRIKADEGQWTGEDGARRRSVTYHTPHGDVDEIYLYGNSTIWREKYLFKGPEDYAAIVSLIEDYTYEPCFERFIKDDTSFGEQGIARPSTEKSPFFAIMYEIMGVENFAVEWAENRSSVMELYHALLETQRKRLRLVAGSPAQYAIVDGNIEMSIVGAERFDSFYKPVIKEFSELLHAKGKVAGLHLDGNNSRLLGPVGDLPVDIIESFTPPPDCDVSISEALLAWPDKKFMVNFPSSLHLLDGEQIRKSALQLMEEGVKSGRVMMGVIEDVPREESVILLARIMKDYMGNADDVFKAGRKG